MSASYTVALPNAPSVSAVPGADTQATAATSVRLVRITRGVFVGTALLFVALMSFGVFQIQTRSQSIAVPRLPSSRPQSLAPVYSLAAGKVIPEERPAGKPPIREVHIANTGLMLLRGATVLSNTGSEIRVGMEWGSADFAWTLKVDSNTKYLTAKGVPQTSKDVVVGDFVTVTGMLITSGAEPRIDAEYVREN